jgi:membrane peptidoglycan carboxypeptidase
MASRTLRRRSSYRALGRHSKHRSRPILRILVVFVVGFTMLTSGASAGTLFFYGQNLPTLTDFKKRFGYQNTVIRDRYNNVLYDMANVSKGHGSRVVEPLVLPGHTTQYYRQNKEDWLVGPEDHGIPMSLQNATISTEDASFYSNLGFDPLSIARAEYDNLTKGHIVSGASTITQQLVREYMLSPSPTLSRKTEEIILAAELTQKYQKSEILWYYLNSVPYGSLSIGAEAAAEQYFHVHVWQLGPAQSAFLAGLPEAPSTYDPVNNLPAALNRMREVLHLMYVHGYLKDRQRHSEQWLIDHVMARTKKWRFTPPKTLKKYPHFVEYAIQQLQSIPQLRGKIYSGLDVQTTLDPRLQDAAQATVTGQINQLGAYNVTDGALVSMDLRPRCYGCIRAMVGSADYNNVAISGQINMANRPRQPGSSFKPFNYIYGFQNGLAPGTTVLDGPIAIPDVGNPADGGLYTPIDYDHTWHGVVTLRVALDNSLNVPAVRVEQFNASTVTAGVHGAVGSSVGDEAVKMGIKSLYSDNPSCCGWALTLGGLAHGVRLVEETSAYGTFASGGRTVPPIAIEKVWDRTTHKLLYDAARDGPKPDRVMNPAYAYLMNNVLSDNASRCTPAVCEFGLDSPLNLGRTAAAKTGTTESFTDNWTVGYTPDIVTGVWVGNANSNPMVGTTGITGAAPIWHDYMLRAFQILNLPPKEFVEPPGVVSGSTCSQHTAYTTFSSTVYDLSAGVIPYCSVGTFDTAITAPSTAPYQAPTVGPAIPATTQPAAPIAPQTAPTQSAPVPAPTNPAAPAPRPTAPAAQQPTGAAPTAAP